MLNRYDIDVRAEKPFRYGQVELLRRIAESPTAIIVPRGSAGVTQAPAEDPLDELDRLYLEGLIVNVRIVRARDDPQAAIAFSARLTSAGRANLARSL